MRPLTRAARFGLLAFALMLGTGAAEAAAAVPEASFIYAPADPRAGDEITFTDTSTGFSGTAPLDRDWDLDGDGQYDVASGATAVRSYTAGDHTVALRVRQSGAVLIERSKRATITVGPGAGRLAWPGRACRGHGLSSVSPVKIGDEETPSSQAHPAKHDADLLTRSSR